MSEANNSDKMKDRQLFIPSISIGAFLLSDELDKSLTDLYENEGVGRAKLNRYWGGSQAALQQLNIESYDLILIEFDDEAQNIGSIVEKIASMCPSGTKAIVAGRVNDINLYRNLIDLGVSEYIPAPFCKDKIKKSLVNIYCENTSEQCRSIAFIGSKGGVGTSVLAHNVAHYTSEKLKRSTILVDFDLNFGISNFNFRVNNKKEFQDVIGGINSIDSILMKRILFEASDRLSVFSYKSPIQKTQNISKDIINRIHEQCRQLTDFAILDIGNELSAKHNDLINSVNDIVIVAEPNIINLRNTVSIIDFIKDLCSITPRIIIILNNVNKNGNTEIPKSEFVKLTGIENCFDFYHYPNDFSRAEQRETNIFSGITSNKSSKHLVSILDKLFDNDNNYIKSNKKVYLNFL